MGMSVLTLVKNRSTHLARMIEGLVRSETPPVELIVVDMGGGWKAPDIDGFPIRIIDMQSDGLPLAEARNAAAGAATSDRLLFLDVDCIPARHLIDSIDRHVLGSDALICGEVRYLGPGDITDDWREDSLMKLARLHPARSFPVSGLRRESNPGLFWSLLFAMRRSTFMRLEGFDSAFRGYGAEDTDFGFRAALAGLPLLFAAAPGAFHQHHAVYDPPLQHFADIVANAGTFHRKWNRWPMGGWLDSFESMGLIRRLHNTLQVVRAPTADEIMKARRETPF